MSEPIPTSSGVWGSTVSSLSGSGVKPKPPRVLMLFVFSDDLSCYGKSRVQVYRFFGLICLRTPLIEYLIPHAADQNHKT